MCVYTLASDKRDHGYGRFFEGCLLLEFRNYKLGGLVSTSPRAGHTVKPNKLKLWSLEQRKVYCMAMQGELVAHALKKP